MKFDEKKEMKKLSRAELLDIILEMKKNEEDLQSKLAEKQEELKKREILIENAGSIAEASIAITGVFEAAQRTADLYVESVLAKYANMAEECARAEKERRELLCAAKTQAQRITEEAEQKCAHMIEATMVNICERESRLRQAVVNVYSSNPEPETM